MLQLTPNRYWFLSLLFILLLVFGARPNAFEEIKENSFSYELGESNASLEIISHTNLGDGSYRVAFIAKTESTELVEMQLITHTVGSDSLLIGSFTVHPGEPQYFYKNFELNGKTVDSIVVAKKNPQLRAKVFIDQVRLIGLDVPGGSSDYASPYSQEVYLENDPKVDREVSIFSPVFFSITPKTDKLQSISVKGGYIGNGGGRYEASLYEKKLEVLSSEKAISTVEFTGVSAIKDGWIYLPLASRVKNAQEYIVVITPAQSRPTRMSHIFINGILAASRVKVDGTTVNSIEGVSLRLSRPKQSLISIGTYLDQISLTREQYSCSTSGEPTDRLMILDTSGDAVARYSYSEKSLIMNKSIGASFTFVCELSSPVLSASMQASRLYSEYNDVLLEMSFDGQEWFVINENSQLGAGQYSGSADNNNDSHTVYIRVSNKELGYTAYPYFGLRSLKVSGQLLKK